MISTYFFFITVLALLSYHYFQERWVWENFLTFFIVVVLFSNTYHVFLCVPKSSRYLGPRNLPQFNDAWMIFFRFFTLCFILDDLHCCVFKFTSFEFHYQQGNFFVFVYLFWQVFHLWVRLKVLLFSFIIVLIFCTFF